MLQALHAAVQDAAAAGAAVDEGAEGVGAVVVVGEDVAAHGGWKEGLRWGGRWGGGFGYVLV